MNSIIKKPWGYFEVLTSGKNFLVKKIMVKQGGILSLQNHQYRSEHWIVAEGEAEITINEKIKTIKENESIFIPQGAIHRMANKTKFIYQPILFLQSFYFYTWIYTKKNIR